MPHCDNDIVTAILCLAWPSAAAYLSEHRDAMIAVSSVMCAEVSSSLVPHFG